MTQPVTNPIRGPIVCPTNAYTEPALANTPARRTNPQATSPTPSPATTYASGAARPSRRAGSTAVIDIASVGAMTPTDTAAVASSPRRPRRRRGAARGGRRRVSVSTGGCRRDPTSGTRTHGTEWASGSPRARDGRAEGDRPGGRGAARGRGRPRGARRRGPGGRLARPPGRRRRRGGRGAGGGRGGARLRGAGHRGGERRRAAH